MICHCCTQVNFIQKTTVVEILRYSICSALDIIEVFYPLLCWLTAAKLYGNEDKMNKIMFSLGRL